MFCFQCQETAKNTGCTVRGAVSYTHLDVYKRQVQYELINILAEESRNLCVCGDPDQSIYEWRGADIRNILDFESDYPDATVIKLEQNYRSTQIILDIANNVISRNQSRKEKDLWTQKDVYKRQPMGNANRDLATGHLNPVSEVFFGLFLSDWTRIEGNRDIWNG